MEVVSADIKEIGALIEQSLEIQTASKKRPWRIKSKDWWEYDSICEGTVTNLKLEGDNASKDDIAMSRQENEEQKILQEDADSKPTTSGW